LRNLQKKRKKKSKKITPPRSSGDETEIMERTAISRQQHKLAQEAVKLKHLADDLDNSDQKELANLYLRAGLKWLESAHLLEKEKKEQEALQMYRETAFFVLSIGKKFPEVKSAVSLCYQIGAVTLARVFF